MKKVHFKLSEEDKIKIQEILVLLESTDFELYYLGVSIFKSLKLWKQLKPASLGMPYPKYSIHYICSENGCVNVKYLFRKDIKPYEYCSVGPKYILKRLLKGYYFIRFE